MKKNRSESILEFVNQHQQVAVSELAAAFDVSLVTIRKDLTTLEEKGLLKRHHGMATVNDSDDLNYRLAQNYEIKQKIAIEAANLVESQDTIMIESGSTCALLAQQLGKQKKQVTIITNSAFIANFVRNFASLTIILLGGNYQPHSQVMVGPLTSQAIENFSVNYLFVGTDGFDAQKGFYCSDMMRAEVVKKMRASAQQLTILTDSSKFEKSDLVHQFSLDEVDNVITDDRIEPRAKKAIHQAQVNLQTVVKEK